ncbi:MAG: TIR domain-containing protein [Magnetococcales bacterium]|nr:TIR domain-containing protein [Magnetococcales bacterium]
MPKLHKYRIFISHPWKYDEEYKKLKEMLGAAPNFDYNDWSIPEEKGRPTMSDTELKNAISYQISHAEIVIALAGMYVMYSDWIQFEIIQARDISKPVLPIMPRGNEKFPSILKFAEKNIVGWYTPSIIDSIRELTGH